MMKNNIYNIKGFLIGLLTIALFSACSDFLFQEPDEQVSINEQFSTEAGLLQTVNGLYYGIEGVLSSNYFVYADILGGNVTFSPNSLGELSIPAFFENAFDYDDKEEDSDYKNFYKNSYGIINRCNMILEHLYDAPDVSDQLHQQIKAEATAARGFMHFLLSLLYSQNMNYSTEGDHLGIVYVRELLEAGKDYPTRETKKMTYELIKKDLNEALSLFTEEQVFNYGHSYSYFNALNTKALLARVALDNNDWQTAYTAADSILSLGTIPFLSQENYISAWEDSMTIPEAIFEFSAPTNSEGSVSSSVESSYFWYTLRTDSLGNVTYLQNMKQAFVASKDLMSSFESNDIRSQLYQPIVISTLIGGVKVDSTFYYVDKFKNDANTTFMRLSELYLIRAEAQFMMDKSQLTQAVTDLNMTIERAGLTPLQNILEEEFLEELYQERRRELAFEGHLFFDHMRLQRNVSRGEDTYGATRSLNYPNTKFVLPIPRTTLDVNEFLEQNEEY